MNQPVKSAGEIALKLLAIGALNIAEKEPFHLPSTLRSPMYCDNRLTLAYPPLLEELIDAFEDKIAKFKLQPEVIVGVATAGIPIATLLAHRLALPMTYARPQAKDHGMKRQIEGKVTAGQRAIVVEDLVHTGGSSLNVVDAVRHAYERPPEAVLCIFTYGVPGVNKRFSALGSPLIPLTDLDSLLEAAEKNSLLSTHQVESLRSYRADPWTWTAKMYT